MLFTSGTTGSPKAVAISHRALTARVRLNAEQIGAHALKTTLLTLPTFFGHGLIGNALTALLSGAHLVVPQIGLKLAQSLGTIIDEQRISFMSSVPSFWHFVLDRVEPPRGGSLQRVHVGSAPLSVEMWQAIVNWAGCEVWNCYGMTEASNWIAGASSNDGYLAGRAGKPWGGRAAVRQEDSTIADRGEGEIVIQTPSLMSGYYRNPDLTQAALHDGWFRTGDTGRVDDTGEIWLGGRIKEEINKAGIKVQPIDIDLLLTSHPAIKEACCFGIPNFVSSEIIGVAVCLHEGVPETEQTLKTWIRQRIRRESVPDKWFFVESIPRLSNGKISRQAVRNVLTS